MDRANPVGTILSVAMLLRWGLKWNAEADAVEAAVDAALNAGARTADIGGGAGALGTEAMTAAILAHLC